MTALQSALYRRFRIHARAPDGSLLPAAAVVAAVPQLVSARSLRFALDMLARRLPL